MVSAANWLNDLGTPPPEVCLDWAWQLQSYFTETSNLVRSDATDLPWQRIEVRPNGELVLPSDFQNYSPSARLRELVRWAQPDDHSVLDDTELLAGGDSNDLRERLRRLTASYVSGNVQQSCLVPDSQDDASPLAAADESESFVTHVSQQSRQRKTKGSRKSRSDAPLVSQIVVAIKRHKLAASLVASGLALACIFVLFLSDGKMGTGETRASTTVDPSQDNNSIPAEEFLNSTSPDLDAANLLGTIPEVPQLEMSEPEVDIGPITMPSIASSRIIGAGRKELDGSASGPLSETELTGAMPTEQAPARTVSSSMSSELPSIVSLETSDVTNRDVMQELDALTKSAANSAIESDVTVPDSMNASASTELVNLEPMMLATSPMVQTHKLASKIKVRPRQPVWQIRLSVDDEFELTPVEPQTVSERQVTTWFLTDSDAESPMVRLVIQAQAAPGRQSALRWRVFASAEDLADLMLPLDKELLNPLQDRLRFFAQASQREADRLKQLALGAERDVRAAMAKQRVNLESQSKLASRISTVVAEARLVDDLLRSQLTVHAKLQDGTDVDAQTILQFGEPSKIQNSKEDTEAKEIAD